MSVNMLRLLLLMFFFSLTAASGQELEVGADAPQLMVVDQNGEQLDFGKALASGTVVVFFYPKAGTPGCTKQACSLGTGFFELKQRGVQVFGVSGDSVASQRKFQEKFSLPYPLIADTDLQVNKAFGKKRFARQAYIFHDGKLVWRDLEAATSTQFDEIIEALDSLGIGLK